MQPPSIRRAWVLSLQYRPGIGKAIGGPLAAPFCAAEKRSRPRSARSAKPMLFEPQASSSVCTGRRASQRSPVAERRDPPVKRRRRPAYGFACKSMGANASGLCIQFTFRQRHIHTLEKLRMPAFPGITFIAARPLGKPEVAMVIAPAYQHCKRLLDTVLFHAR